VRLGPDGLTHDSEEQDAPRFTRPKAAQGMTPDPAQACQDSAERRDRGPRTPAAKGFALSVRTPRPARRRRMRRGRAEHPGPELLGSSAGRGRVFGDGHDARAERLIMLGRSPPRAEHFKVGVPGHRRSANRPPSDREPPPTPSRSRGPGPQVSTGDGIHHHHHGL
jgi:hypothetical protein